MQDYEIQKLRKRLKNHGYTQIHIKYFYRDHLKYIFLTCVEPIFGTVLSGIVPFSNIINIP